MTVLVSAVAAILGWLATHWPYVVAAWLLASYPAARALSAVITVRDRHDRKD